MPAPAGNRPDPRQPARVVATARDILADGGYPEADRLAMRLLATQWAARTGLPALIWPALTGPDAGHEAVYQARRHLSGLVMDGWDVCDLGAAYEHLLNPGHRAAMASYYTPPRAAAAMVRFSIGLAVERMVSSADPRAVLHVLAVDPACGAGVFLVEAARFITAAYAERIAGRSDPALARVLVPEVMAECVFGMDRDPVAVDLARAALWAEMGGEQPVTYMDRNVVCVNSLSGADAQPPKLAERLGEDPRQAARVCGLEPGRSPQG